MSSPLRSPRSSDVDDTPRKTEESVAVHSGSPDFAAEVEAAAPLLKGPRLTAAIAFVAGTGFTLFGYDQGVMSALLSAKQFEDVFPQVIVDSNHPSNDATLQSFIVAIYEIGCLIGALSNLWVGDWLGRRRTIVLGGIIMIIGAILQTTSFSYAQMVVARIITGLGNGLNTSTVPSYHAECSPAARRGSLIMIEGSLITLGIMISYWIDFAFFWLSGSSAQWRVPIALQILLAFMMIVGIFFLPESPRWLAKHGRNAEALAVISALEGKPHTDADVHQTYHAIREAVAAETHFGNDSSPLREIFTGGPSQNFRRAFLGVVVQCFQQITGINIITYYATLLFERLGIDDVKARIIAACNGTEYFLASLIAIFLIDRVGRRPLMLFGAVGQTITMILLAVLGRIDTSGTQVASAVLLFVFNSFFAVGWLGMTWLYPAEIVGLRIRAPANAFSTASNWTFNFMVVMITGPSFNNISWRTYIVFASLNALLIPVVYLFLPETAGRSLEDMDVIFALAYKEGVSPVKVSLRKDVPAAGSPEADEILGITTSSRIGSFREDAVPRENEKTA
ncbi:general substrate transporter [Dichomitus squalens LYAD-421 SS1]|uniref:General substrate transporter n=1 Tax=Dichomitus squalens (strain LYAD-421) TaxID=732165 RepID=R7SNP3_DICSQ|nr:general substrate transporter [Dichomitus squalens LYAD-421 SS1]EJF56602.1 general substrate transporter [Dichomitus squalens LYAD-421 SS1]